MEEDNKVIHKVVNGDKEAFGQLITRFKEILGAVSCEVTRGKDKDTAVIYLGFDTKPSPFIGENKDMIIISLD